MKITVSPNKAQVGVKAAADAAQLLRKTLAARGEAKLIVATGASQFEMLAELIKAPDIAWNKVTAFHLDEYVGMSIDHPASFRLYLWRRFVSQLPLPLRAFNYVNADGSAADAKAECQRLGEIIKRHPIDVALIGIGENGHIAFNDPPADFETDAPYIVVNLDDACRQQQFGEGWFETFEKVPTLAISMSVKQIMKSKAIVCTVPDQRKAAAVQAAVEGPVTPKVPASILQRHESVLLHLDAPAASLLKK